MKVVVPSAYRGLRFPRLTEITFDEFDVERLLPGLFFLVVTGGRARGKTPNDPKLLRDYVEALSNHQRLDGFQSEAGRKLLERWVRTSVVRVSTAGKARQDEQIESLHPFSLLTYKAGWPEQGHRLRNVDSFLYSQMIEALRGESGGDPPARKLRAILTRTFGAGVETDPSPPYDGRYDGSTRVDAETLLGLAFLDVLSPTPARASAEVTRHRPALPRVARAIATDLLVFLSAYGIQYRDGMTLGALTRGMMALINFELFIYTTKLVDGVAELVRTGSLPALMGPEPDGFGPELYVDFTRERESPSDDLARACAQRDLTALRRFFEQLVFLRALDRFADDVGSLAAKVDGLDGPDYLHALLQESGSPQVLARAQAELGLIRETSLASASSPADETEIEDHFKTLLLRDDADALATLADLLAEAQAKTRVESLVKWVGSVGGCNQPFGLIRGLSKRRSSWRYQMSDDLLASLVQLAVVHADGDGDRISLENFLGFLDARFGILVARPPRLLDDSAARAAARNNLDAMKRRLRQMGFFADLSDDFTAQYIYSPLRGGE